MSTRSFPLALLATLALAAPGCDKETTMPVATVGDDGELGDGFEEGEAGEDGEDGEDGESGDDGEAGDADGDSDGDSDSDDSKPAPMPRPTPVTSCIDADGDYNPDRYSEDCTTEDGEDGRSFCLVVDGEEFWTECSIAEACEPYDSFDDGCFAITCYWDGEALQRHIWETSDDDCMTPLVVALDDRPLGFEPAGAAAFDISGVGECLSTDWPTHPWLALDRDGDGVISSGRELFGSGTVLASGGRADHGFAALAELDADGDGKITAADPAFAELVLWSDHDGDRQGTWSELVPVMAVDLVAIHLDYEHRVECDDRGNCGAQRAAFEYKDALGARRSGEIVDVYLACQ